MHTTLPARPRTLLPVALCIGALAALAGCASQTTARSAWHDAAMRGSQFDKVLVVAMTDVSDRRMSFEDAVAQELQGKSTQAWPSSRSMDTTIRVDKDTVTPVARKLGATAIVVTQVTSLQVKPVEVEAYTDVMARRKEGTAFRYDYIEKEQTGYTTQNYTTVLTTDVYAAASGQHIYTMVSTAKGQQSANEVIAALSSVIAKRLRSDGVIR